MENPRIVVLEPNYRGHRMNYVAHIIKWCSRNNIAAQVATSSDTTRSSEFALRFPHGFDTDTLIDMGDLPSIEERYYFRWVRDQIKKIALSGPDVQIVVLEGDKLLASSVLWLPRYILTRVTLLIMRAPNPPTIRSRQPLELLKWILIRVARVRGTRVLALSPAVRPSDTYTYRGMPAVPDPVDVTGTVSDAISYRAAHGLSANRRWIGIFGHVTPRKNADLIAKAIAESADASNCGLLIAGKMSSAEEARCHIAFNDLTEAGGVLVFHNALLTDVELDAALQSVDIAAVAHSSDGPSGILARAAANGTAVLTAGPLSLQEDLVRLDAVGDYVPLTIEGLARGIDTLLNHRDSGAPAVAPADGNDFARSILPRLLSEAPDESP